MSEPSESTTPPSSDKNRILDTMQTKAQEVLNEDYSKYKTMVSSAARSRAYSFPIRGLLYFLFHSSLWSPLLSVLLPYLALSVGVFAAMFFLTYLPQFAVLLLFNGPFAVFSTVLLILNESSFIVNTVARAWMLQDALLDTFDGTMVAKGQGAVVREGRELKGAGGSGDPMARLGKVLKSPFSGWNFKALVRYFMYLPLNFIPVVGTVIFVILQGRARGRSVHERYFQLKKWSSAQQSEWLEKHTGPYIAFGLVAILLEMIPLASIVFAFTNTVGAALWAAEIESKATTMTDSTAPGLRDAAKKAE